MRKVLSRSEAKRLTIKYSHKVREILRINDLSQSELALVFKTSSQSVSRWCNEKQLPSAEYRQLIDEEYKKAIQLESTH